MVLPTHVAFIMDGNGRWAERQGQNRTAGHTKGVDTFKEIAEACIDLGVAYATFYAFSTENWSRPKYEVNALMKLFDQYLDEFDGINKKNARLNFIGDFTVLPKNMQKKIAHCAEITKGNTGSVISVAINYGGRDEIVSAVKKLCAQAVHPDTITQESFARQLYSGDLPDVDLLIRTGGDMRLSNFLLWKSSYAELMFFDKFWPDFGKDDLTEAFSQYSRKDRRFGGLNI